MNPDLKGSGSSLTAAVLAKLSALYPLTPEDAQFVSSLLSEGSRILPPGTDIATQGQRNDTVHVILEGHAYRYKLMADGRRQIIGFLVPGDFCDLYAFLLDRMDHSIAARTPCRVVDLTEDAILAMTARPMLARALWWGSLVEDSILREWLVNIGRRPADRRVAHILCELLIRLRIVGQASENSFRLTLSQNELADTVGLTSVSVNRALQKLRRLGLIAGSGREIVIPNVSQLMSFAEFDPIYLHHRDVRNEAAE